MSKAAWKPCFNPAEMLDFPIGEPHFPLPDIEKCSDDYTKLGFPRGWHSVAGFGLVLTPEGHFVGRAAQDCKEDNFQPERIKVVQRVCSDGIVRNVVYTSSGGVKAGRATLTHDYDTSVKWGKGVETKNIISFLPSSESVVPIRLNPEIRGKLTFHPKAEGGLVVSVIRNEEYLKLFWWYDGRDGDLISKRQQVEIKRHLRKDIWHRLVIRLKATEIENEWQARVNVFEQGVRVLKKELPSFFLINGVESAFNLHAGDEIEGDTAGGVVYYDRLSAMQRIMATVNRK